MESWNNLNTGIIDFNSPKRFGRTATCKKNDISYHLMKILICD